MNEHVSESAGRLATLAVPRTAKDRTVASVLAEVQSFSDEYETVDYIYVLEDERLVGVISIHELLASKPDSLVANIMTQPVAYVHTSTDQEKVADLALAQNIKAVPVVTDDGVFAGTVQSDAILRILQDEHKEDVLRYAGINVSASERLANFTLYEHLTSRLPWLVIGLGGGLLAAWVVDKYSYAIEAELALAAFIPAIVYMADSVGSQTQMVYVRSLTGYVKDSFFKRLKKELFITTFVGLVLSILIAIVSWFWLENTSISLILSISVLITVYFSVFVAVVLPWAFNKMGKDPALATGPLATVIRDVSSLAIYFFIALQIL